MLSQQRLEMYRKMTPGERLALSMQAMREAFPLLFVGPPEVVERRFARIRQLNDEHNRALREGLARAEGRHEDAD